MATRKLQQDPNWPSFDQTYLVPHPVILLLPPPPEEGHLNVDEPLGRVAGQEWYDGVEDVLDTDFGDLLDWKETKSSLKSSNGFTHDSILHMLSKRAIR